MSFSATPSHPDQSFTFATQQTSSSAQSGNLGSRPGSTSTTSSVGALLRVLPGLRRALEHTTSSAGASSTRTTSTASSSGQIPAKAAPPKAATANFLLTEERHLLLASGGYVTRRTREFILCREFLDHLEAVASPLLSSNFGVVPEQEFRRRVREILDVLQQNPHFFALATRLMRGTLTPALEWMQPEGTPPSGAHRPGGLQPEESVRRQHPLRRHSRQRPALSPRPWTTTQPTPRSRSWKFLRPRRITARAQKLRIFHQHRMVLQSATDPPGTHLRPGHHRPWA